MGITIECSDCNNKRNSLVDRLAGFIATIDIDESICNKHCKFKNEESVDIYDCIDCIIECFDKSCKWEQDEVCVNDESKWCADFVDGVKCGGCRYYEIN